MTKTQNQPKAAARQNSKAANSKAASRPIPDQDWGEEEPEPPAPKRLRAVKMRAVQKLLHDDRGLGERIVEEGEVFMYRGTELPSENIAVIVDADTPLGLPPEEPLDRNAPKPSWTTQGYVDRANRRVGSQQ